MDFVEKKDDASAEAEVQEPKPESQSGDEGQETATSSNEVPENLDERQRMAFECAQKAAEELKKAGECG